MSIVPYRDPRARRRRPLDREQVVRASLLLLDEVGLDAFTMRRLAERLGVKAASLYRHVRDKEELLVLLADEICGAIPTAVLDGPWEERLLAMGRNYRRALLARRDAARVLAGTAPFGPNRLRLVEITLRALRSGGLSKRNAASAGYHLNGFVTEFVADEGRYAAAAAALGVSRRRMFSAVREQFMSLPPDEFPTIIELADELARDDPDGLFEFGLRAWLAGLAPLRRGRRR
ncbi:MAG TPA: TetR/AcrR family transcriptional regulator C-terminal domain-containing protein [Anaeromyxobacteraceae bacterium]